MKLTASLHTSGEKNGKSTQKEGEELTPSLDAYTSSSDDEDFEVYTDNQGDAGKGKIRYLKLCLDCLRKSYTDQDGEVGSNDVAEALKSIPVRIYLPGVFFFFTILKTHFSFFLSTQLY